MKAQKTFGVLFAATIACTTIISCKKDKDNTANCRIVTITETSSGGNTVYNMTYNNDRKVSTITVSKNGSSIEKLFIYSANTIIVSSTKGGLFVSRDSITLDDRGRPVNMRHFSDEAGIYWTNDVLEYNGDDLSKFHHTDNVGSPPETSTAIYINGNMVGLSYNGGSSALEYFTDKAVQQGDYLEIASFVQYGVSLYPHKNLLKSFANGPVVTNLDYEFGADGLISKVAITNGTQATSLAYQYQCN